MVQQALLNSCRYHHPKTQRLMLAYRIGSVKQPWVNFVPPLHGGVYRKSGVDNLDIAVPEDDVSDQSSDTAVYCSSDTSVTGSSSDQDNLKQRITRRAAARKPRSDASLSAALEGEATEPETRPPWTHLSKVAYTAMLEQKEVHQATQEYPSLDLETQQSISREYRALHERIKDEGHYECRYSEYGKDAIRWAVLFGLFLASFNAKWYLTSAVFLGMFWVRRRRRKRTG
jgi:delta8-fatty-acid desaturase